VATTVCVALQETLRVGIFAFNTGPPYDDEDAGHFSPQIIGACSASKGPRFYTCMLDHWQFMAV
jgi:hypothetical protein